jgi:hypothetical protein
MLRDRTIRMIAFETDLFIFLDTALKIERRCYPLLLTFSNWSAEEGHYARALELQCCAAFTAEHGTTDSARALEEAMRLAGLR